MERNEIFNNVRILEGRRVPDRVRASLEAKRSLDLAAAAFLQVVSCPAALLLSQLKMGNSDLRFRFYITGGCDWLHCHDNLAL